MAFIGRSAVYGNFETQVLTPDSVTTSFALTFGVGAAGSLLVVYGGVVQQPSTAYTIGNGGQSIVFSEPPVTGTTLYIVYMGKQMYTPRAVAEPWFTITSNTTAQVGSAYFCDTTSGAFTLTLPALPSIGDTIRFNDLAGTFGTNNLTIGRNGNKINGSATDMIVSVNNAANSIVYSGASYGWKLREV